MPDIASLYRKLLRHRLDQLMLSGSYFVRRKGGKSDQPSAACGWRVIKAAQSRKFHPSPRRAHHGVALICVLVEQAWQLKSAVGHVQLHHPAQILRDIRCKRIPAFMTDEAHLPSMCAQMPDTYV